MEEAFSGSNTNLSSYIDIDRKIYFSSEGTSFNINDANCLYTSKPFTFFNDIYKIFRLSRLTDQNYCFVLSDIRNL